MVFKNVSHKVFRTFSKEAMNTIQACWCAQGNPSGHTHRSDDAIVSLWYVIRKYDSSDDECSTRRKKVIGKSSN